MTAGCPVGRWGGGGEGKDGGGGGEEKELHDLWEGVVVSIESVECELTFLEDGGCRLSVVVLCERKEPAPEVLLCLLGGTNGVGRRPDLVQINLTNLEF